MTQRHADAVYPARCKHFIGIQHPCRAGVYPHNVRDVSQPGPARWPCLTPIGRQPATTTCALFTPMTPADFDAEEDEITAAIAAADAADAAGKCHVCGGPIEPSRIDGRCKYGACGHRIGQVL